MQIGSFTVASNSSSFDLGNGIVSPERSSSALSVWAADGMVAVEAPEDEADWEGIVGRIGPVVPEKRRRRARMS